MIQKSVTAHIWDCWFLFLALYQISTWNCVCPVTDWHPIQAVSYPVPCMSCDRHQAHYDPV